MEITKCLNEWNAIIEALGQGKQSILIRKNATHLTEFLLYPTITYAKKSEVLNSFKDIEFVKDNLLPNGDEGYEVKYYATVEDIVDVPPTRIDTFDKFHIWTQDHVKNYLKRNNAKIWLLRIYKLDNPKKLKRSWSMMYSNVEKPIKLEGKPVIPDEEFEKLKEEILNIH